MSDDLYHMTIDTAYGHERLVQISGTRDTVLDVALRVLLDSAPRWLEHPSVPTFNVTLSKDVK